MSMDGKKNRTDRNGVDRHTGMVAKCYGCGSEGHLSPSCTSSIKDPAAVMRQVGQRLSCTGKYKDSMSVLLLARASFEEYGPSYQDPDGLSELANDHDKSSVLYNEVNQLSSAVDAAIETWCQEEFMPVDSLGSAVKDIGLVVQEKQLTSSDDELAIVDDFYYDAVDSPFHDYQDF
jgi:hypothetical protein